MDEDFVIAVKEMASKLNTNKEDLMAMRIDRDDAKREMDNWRGGLIWRELHLGALCTGIFNMVGWWPEILGGQQGNVKEYKRLCDFYESREVRVKELTQQEQDATVELDSFVDRYLRDHDPAYKPIVLYYNLLVEVKTAFDQMFGAILGFEQATKNTNDNMAWGVATGNPAYTSAGYQEKDNAKKLFKGIKTNLDKLMTCIEAYDQIITGNARNGHHLASNALALPEEISLDGYMPLDYKSSEFKDEMQKFKNYAETTNQKIANQLAKARKTCETYKEIRIKECCVN